MKTMKKITVLAVAAILSTGALFAQPKPENGPRQPNGNEPQAPEMQLPPPAQNAGKLLGIVDEVTNNSFTFIDMDGKKVTVAVTPFTELQDIEKAGNIDPKAKDAKDQLKRSYLVLNQLHKGHWIDAQAYKTAGGKLVAEYVRVIRMPANGGEK